MKHFYPFFLSFLFSGLLSAQTNPAITSWIINTTGATGYGGIESNVQQVQYSSNNVYISCSSVPAYTIGPWQANPNVPSDQNHVFKITLNPAKNTGTLVNTPLGHIGVWSNGVSIYDPEDGMSYNNAGVWNQNALYYEGISFDDCLGHPAGNGEYHHHVNPDCLYDKTDSSQHSPIIGYAFDGFPIYGAYGYSDTIGTGPIKRMKSSYELSSNTTRASGPVVDTAYPAGCFIEDYNYVAGSGDLDEHNGRFCVTPEYPGGIYAYFVTIDDTLYPSYPFVIGPTYYGTVQAGNTGPGSGHVTITETVTTYNPTGIPDSEATLHYRLFPNPCREYVYLFVEPANVNNMIFSIVDINGREVFVQENIQPANTYSFYIAELPEGIYLANLVTGTRVVTRKLVISK